MFGTQPLGGLLLGLLGVLILGALAYWASRPPRRVEDLPWRERRRVERHHHRHGVDPLDR